MNHDTTGPLHEQPRIHDRRWFLLAVMCLSLVMVVMAVSGLNVAIPSLQRSLDATATDLQWIVDSYAIVFAGLLLSAGALGDRFGRKLALQVGLAVFVAGSLIGALADSPPMVIVSRVVMGIGAAFIMPATLSLISAIFAPHERGKAIAIWAGFAGAGGALGPLVVGFLLTGWWIFPSFWWGSSFVVNIVTASLVFVAVTVFSPDSRDDAATPLDPVGALLSMVGLAALLFGIIEGPERGWTDAAVLIGFVVAIVGLVGFVGWELRTAHPMLPMRFFRDRRFSTGSAVITFAFLAMFGFFFLLSQYLQFVRGYSPLDSGVATLPLAGAVVIVAPRSAGLSQRLGYHRVVGTGLVLIVLGFLVMSQVHESSPYLLIAFGLVLLGAGMGMTTAPSTGSIMSAVPLNKAGVGSAVNDTTREVGGALGIALLGSIASSAYRGGIDVSFLPAELAGPAHESIGGAAIAAQSAGGETAGRIIHEAGSAFTDAFNSAMFAAAAIALVTGIAVMISGRRRPQLEPAGAEVAATL